MLGDRQELDMGEAEIGDIGNEFCGELVIGHEPPVGVTAP